jgi:ABC-type molybdate transport system ATPase subunit
MKTREFYKRLKDDMLANTDKNRQHLIKDIQITSLEQVLGLFRSVMIKNSIQYEESIQMRKELKNLCSVLGISEKDLT